MEFRTIVDVPSPGYGIGPFEEMLFVGSCFADNIGRRFEQEQFPVTINPYGTMYNPASILHTIERLYGEEARRPWTVAFLTLGTNHVYRLKATGEIVDNCQKRPQTLFSEEMLTVEACAGYLRRAIGVLRQMNPAMRIVLTVSPIRYRKYGYHGSQLSKATLLLAADSVAGSADVGAVDYFPAYEIVNDELRDYRFYADDMLHPSAQAVEYLWQRLTETYLTDEARTFLREWQPLKAALGHRPFDPGGDAYRQFMAQTEERIARLYEKYGKKWQKEK